MPDDPIPDHLRPFVLTPPPVVPRRDANLDLYVPAAERSPAVVFVHGGPVPQGVTPTPRDWPVYRGYGAAAAERGLVGAILDHRFHSFELIAAAGEDVDDAVDRVRGDARVDADRIALWFFSGAGALMGKWLRHPPPWLRGVAASYPACPPQEALGAAVVAPGAAVRDAGDLPILLTRAGLEQPVLAGWVEEFVASARAADAHLEIIDVPQGRHAFDVLDHTDESRHAVEEAFAWVRARLR